MPMPQTVSVLIPTYNEERSVEAVIRQLLATPSELQREIVVVDDGSRDATGAILQRLQGELPIRIVTHPASRGKGQAIRTGLEHCRGDVILIHDADLEYDPKDHPALLALFESDPAVQVVYGSRFVARPWHAGWHRFVNWVITALINVLYGSRLTDAETCYKVFRADVAGRMALRAVGFEFEVEFTCKLLRLGYTIREVPVGYTRRTYAEGKKITWKDGVQAIWVILCCRLNPRY